MKSFFLIKGDFRIEAPFYAKVLLLAFFKQDYSADDGCCSDDERNEWILYETCDDVGHERNSCNAHGIRNLCRYMVNVDALGTGTGHDCRVRNR